MDNLQIGDVVQLRSGGPAMTITHVANRPSVQCHLFADFEVKFAKLPEGALKKYEGSPEPAG